MPYREDQLCVLVPGSHPLASAPAVRFADLLGETLVALRDESALSRLLSEQAARLNAALRIKIRWPAWMRRAAWCMSGWASPSCRARWASFT
ncbi:LysR substrate-binding domain-containing protein [Cupriavidus basilensis]